MCVCSVSTYITITNRYIIKHRPKYRSVTVAEIKGEPNSGAYIKQLISEEITSIPQMYPQVYNSQSLRNKMQRSLPPL